MILPRRKMGVWLNLAQLAKSRIVDILAMTLLACIGLYLVGHLHRIDCHHTCRRGKAGAGAQEKRWQKSKTPRLTST